MNEQLKLLAQQAGFITYTPTIKAMLEKYGQLVIRECLSEVESVSTGDYGRDEWDDGYDAGLSQASETIKEHFGITNENLSGL
jgi:hypothetical protein